MFDPSQTAVALKPTLKKPTTFPAPPKASTLQAQTMATRVARQATASASTIPTVTITTGPTTSTPNYTIPIAVAVVVANILIILIIFLVNLWKRKRSTRQRLRETSISIPQDEPSPHTRPMSQGSLLPLNPTPQSLASASSTTSSHSFVESPGGVPSPADPAGRRPSSAPPLPASASLLPQSIRSSTTNLSRTPSAPPSRPSAVRPPVTTESSSSTPFLATPPLVSAYQPAPAYQATQTAQLSVAIQPMATITRPEMTYTPPEIYSTGSSSELDYDSFKVAVICALGVEMNMVMGVLDEKFDRLTNQDDGDEHSYVLGRIGRHNVVVVILPDAGSTAAASATANLTRSFKNINVAFIVGICGIVPCHGKTRQEIVLGDVIISTDVINLNRGQHWHQQGFGRTRSVRKALGKTSIKMLSFEKILRTFDVTNSLESRISFHFEELQRKAKDVHDTSFCYPGADRDHLYAADYPHCYHDQRRGSDPNAGRGLTCRQLRCSPDETILRDRFCDSTSLTPAEHNVKIHFGRVGSADVVQKSGPFRDATAREERLIAFEMEAAGVWDNLKTNVMVIKSGSDYCDSHKNDDWQPYAAATAACGLKAVLEEWGSARSSLATPPRVRRPVPPPIPTQWRVNIDRTANRSPTEDLAQRDAVQPSATNLYNMPELEAP